MYCNKCGTRLNMGDKFCPGCGSVVENQGYNGTVTNNNPTVSKDGNKTASIVLGILGLGGSLLVIFSPVALILSIIGLVLAIKANKNTDNIAGIVLNAIGLFFSVIIVAVIGLIIYIAVNTTEDDSSKDLWDYLNEYNEDIDYPKNSSNF